MEWKICNVCGILYPYTPKYFYKESANKSGLRGSCKECERERVRSKYIFRDYMPPLGFKPLPYSNAYYASKIGLVWSKKLGRLMKPYKHPKNKYLQLTIHGRCKKVHQLVLEAFRGMCPVGKEACHYDGNPENNSLDNLRWGTRSENTKDAVRHGTHPVAKLNESKVRNIKRMLQNKVQQKVIAKIYQVDPSTISYINIERIWGYVHVDK